MELYKRLFEAFVAKKSTKSIKLPNGLPLSIVVYDLRDNDESGEELTINEIYNKISEKFPKNLYFSADYKDSLYAKKDDINFSLQSFKTAIEKCVGKIPEKINTAAMNAEVEIYQMLKYSDPKTSPIPVDKYVFLLSKLKELLEENDRMHSASTSANKEHQFVDIKHPSTQFSGKKFHKGLGKSL